jgi:hypothetical protein
MSVFEDHRQFPEVFVERDKNSAFLMREGQDLFIARIGRPVSRPDDIVSCSL